MCKRPAIIFFIFVLVAIVTDFTKAQTRDVELHNLRWDWHSHDPELQLLVPFFRNPETKSIHFEVELNKYRNSYLKFILNPNTFFWIEKQLVFRSEDNHPVYFSIDSLKQVYQKNQLSLTLFCPDLDTRNMRTTVVTKTQFVDAKKSGDYQLRKDLGQTDLFILISIIVLLLIATFRTAHYRLFREYFSISKALQQRQSFDLITAYSPMAWPNIGFIIFYAILVGCSAANISLFHRFAEIELPFQLSQSNSLLIGLKIIGLCLIFILLKLVLISASTALFKLHKVRLIHFFTYFRHSLIIAIAIFIFSLFNGIFEGSLVLNGWSIIQAFVVIVWSGRLVQIFFVLNKIYTFRKLHLFSYLCSTELIPLLLFFKIFLK